MKNISQIALISVALFFGSTNESKSCYPRSIFVPHQLTYNPIFEHALELSAERAEPWNYMLSVKPIYTQSVGSKLQKYFTINHKCSLNVREDGSGDISSLWFNVVSSNDTFYNSTLSFHPKRQTYGGLLYFTAQLPCGFQLAINTAILTARHNMHLCEKDAQHLATIQNLGTCPGFSTIAESFANPERLFGRICGTRKKTGLDDIQVKALYTFYSHPCFEGALFGLLGIPTGKGSKARYLFEPLVGSKHVQLGFGVDGQWQITQSDINTWSLRGEAKYRYAFKGNEIRSFDLKKNGQWSRYMAFVDQTDKYAFYPAINDLTFKSCVSPRSSFDLYVATQFNHCNWNFELGYDLWYRNAEKVSVPFQLFESGIADLRGIALQNPHTANTANISQGIQPGVNQMISDPSFAPITIDDINLTSGAQAASLSNSVYGSIGYLFKRNCYALQVGLNVAYERGTSVNTPDSIATWLNLDLYF